MKVYFLTVVTIFGISFLGFKNIFQTTEKPASNYVVVELFTSEGCSSCPPAEAIMQELQQRYLNEPVIFLQYHVDYWNYLGWKDMFSTEQYSKRQQDYASILHLSEIYTPQVIVNGIFQMVGSNKKLLQSTIQQQLLKSQIKKLDFTINKNMDDITIQLGPTMEKQKQLNYYCGLVLKSVSNKISAGENNGLTMLHNNVVIALKEFSSNKNITIKIPSIWNHKPLSVVCFAQQINNGRIEAIDIKDL